MRTPVAILLLLVSGCAHVGQTADVATTAAGVAQGAAEMNPMVAPMVGSPVGLLALLGLKLGATEWAQRQDVYTCAGMTLGLSDVGWAAAISNGLILAAATPWAFPIGMAGGIGSHYLFKDDIIERCQTWCRKPPAGVSMMDYQRRCPAGWSRS